jgi:hypothetical protein
MLVQLLARISRQSGAHRAGLGRPHALHPYACMPTRAGWADSGSAHSVTVLSLTRSPARLGAVRAEC